MTMYSYKFDDNAAGKARLEGVDASYKDLAEVCSNIRGIITADALSLLEKVAAGEMPIRYRKYTARLGHRKELGGKPGRYPQKAARLVLGALRSAIASAKTKGLSEDLVVVHAAANKKDIFPRLAPKGRRMRSFYETARIEIVVREREASRKTGKKAGEQKPEAKIAGVKKEGAKTANAPKTGPDQPAPAAAKAGEKAIKPETEQEEKPAKGEA